MAEGTSLLRMHTAYTRIVGSNPTVSAKFQRKSHRKVAFFFPASEAAGSALARYMYRQGGRFTASRVLA